MGIAVVFVSLTAAVLIELRIWTDNFHESLGFCVFFMYAAIPKVRVENVLDDEKRRIETHGGEGLKLPGL